jgi:hypothetical protein
MQNPFWAYSRIIFIIVVGLWICSACGSGDADNHYIYSDQTNKSAQSTDANAASDEDSGTAANASGTGDSGAPGGGTNPIANSGGQVATGTGGVNAGSAGSGGQDDWRDDLTSGGSGGFGGQSATGTVPIGGNTVGSCQLQCATGASSCTAMCIASFDPDDRSACENKCLETQKSCSVQCASGTCSGNKDGGQGHQIECESYKMACSGLCNTYFDMNVKNGCEKLCVDNKNKCEGNCESDAGVDAGVT